MFACDAQKGLVVNELPMPSQLVPKPDRKRESTLAEEVVLARWQQQQLLLCCCRISSENFFAMVLFLQTRKTAATASKANGYSTHESHRKDLESRANLATAKTGTTEGTDPTTRTRQPLRRPLDSDMYVDSSIFILSMQYFYFEPLKNFSALFNFFC